MNKFLVGLGVLGAGAVSCLASGDDTLTTTITSIGGYWTAVEAIAVGVLLFVVGRKVVRKI